MNMNYNIIETGYTKDNFYYVVRDIGKGCTHIMWYVSKEAYDEEYKLMNSYK